MRLLVIALPGSPHTARYLNQFVEQDWQIKLFAAAAVPIHANYKIKGLEIYHACCYRPEGLDRSVKIHGFWPVNPERKVVQGLTRWCTPRFLSPANRLARLINRFRPDIIHSLSLIDAGPVVLEAKKLLGRAFPFPPWIVTNWGLDIHFYRYVHAREQELHAVLAQADHYTCECHRDVRLANEMGFRGEIWPVLPNAGGFDLSVIEKWRLPGPASERRTIVVKGYHGLYGRAQVALRALELVKDQLQGYRIAVFGAGEEMKILLEHFRRVTGLPVEVLAPMSHDEMLKLHGSARVSIGMSKTDGVATSFLEALVMGSFPIQSHTACADEWAEHGKNAFLVHPDDPTDVAAGLSLALQNDALVDRAAEMNWRIALQRLNYDAIRQQFLLMYRQILDNKAASTARMPLAA